MLTKEQENFDLSKIYETYKPEKEILRVYSGKYGYTIDDLYQEFSVKNYPDTPDGGRLMLKNRYRAVNNYKTIFEKEFTPRLFNFLNLKMIFANTNTINIMDENNNEYRFQEKSYIFPLQDALLDNNSLSVAKLLVYLMNHNKENYQAAGVEWKTHKEEAYDLLRYCYNMKGTDAFEYFKDKLVDRMKDDLSFSNELGYFKYIRKYKEGKPLFRDFRYEDLILKQNLDFINDKEITWLELECASKIGNVFSLDMIREIMNVYSKQIIEGGNTIAPSNLLFASNITYDKNITSLKDILGDLKCIVSTSKPLSTEPLKSRECKNLTNSIFPLSFSLFAGEMLLTDQLLESNQETLPEISGFKLDNALPYKYKVEDILCEGLSTNNNVNGLLNKTQKLSIEDFEASAKEGILTPLFLKLKIKIKVYNDKHEEKIIDYPMQIKLDPRDFKCTEIESLKQIEGLTCMNAELKTQLKTAIESVQFKKNSQTYLMAKSLLPYKTKNTAPNSVKEADKSIYLSDIEIKDISVKMQSDGKEVPDIKGFSAQYTNTEAKIGFKKQTPNGI